MKKHREEIALQEKLRKKEEKALIQEGKDRWDGMLGHRLFQQG